MSASITWKKEFAALVKHLQRRKVSFTYTNHYFGQLLILNLRHGFFSCRLSTPSFMVEPWELIFRYTSQCVRAPCRLLSSVGTSRSHLGKASNLNISIGYHSDRSRLWKVVGLFALVPKQASMDCLLPLGNSSSRLLHLDRCQLQPFWFRHIGTRL